MIYEFTRATIKHNFPRAVLMTWWERYFIMAAAPRTDRGTEAVGTKNKMLSSNWRKFGGWWVTETREVTGNASRRLQLVTHGFVFRYKCEEEVEGCMEAASRRK